MGGGQGNHAERKDWHPHELATAAAAAALAVGGSCSSDGRRGIPLLVSGRKGALLLLKEEAVSS